MLNFSELSQDGQDLELLLREMLFAQGYPVYWSGRGPDGGRDLLCQETRDSIFVPDTRTWLVQCKHNAHSGKSVSLDDLGDIVDACNHHGAVGYLLVCSTHPSSKVVERLEGITANPKNSISATYWDAVKLEQMLSTPKLWPLAQRFFPISANVVEWKLYATEKPNHWIANYRGYYFHITNRIGSKATHHLWSIADGVAAIENILLPEKHLIRVRAVYYDDKGGAYRWFIDYMRPHKSKPAITIGKMKHLLNDENVWDDGQFHMFDIMEREYLEYSDHYDPDHYDYYVPHIGNFLIGLERSERW